MEGRKIKRNLNEELTQVVKKKKKEEKMKRKKRKEVILLNCEGLTQFVGTYVGK